VIAGSLGDIMKRLCVGLVLAGLMIGAGGARAQTTITVLGYGNSASCGKWVTDRQDKSWEVAKGMAWMQGFFTGLNEGSFMSGHKDWSHIGEHLDIDGAAVWLDNYCREHPLDPFFRAAEQLYRFTQQQGK
jgi:hypothetical protein